MRRRLRRLRRGENRAGRVLRIAFWLTALALVRVPVAAAADAYPVRPILIIIPAPAGGALDIAFRAIRPALSADLGMPMAIENRAGASGVIGMESVALARPDGYTLAATSTSTLTIVAAAAPSVPYTPGDFIPIGDYALDYTVLVVRADAPWRSLAELTGFARTHPGRLSYGSAGPGTLSTLAMEAVKNALGLDIVQVPYPGAPQVTNALLGRQLEIGAIPLSSAAPLLRQGSLRAIVTTAAQRPASFPDVPTLAEAAITRAARALAIGLYAPAGTPPFAIDRLARALRRTIGSASVIATLQQAGLFVQYEDGARVRERLAAEYGDVADPGRKRPESERAAAPSGSD